MVADGSPLLSLLFFGFVAAWIVLFVAGYWFVFAKAGQPGWTAIIPILNVVVMMRIVHRPLWWVLLLIVPIVNIVIMVIVLAELARAYGKGIGFTIGLILLTPIFLLILGYGAAEYRLEPRPIF